MCNRSKKKFRPIFDAQAMGGFRFFTTNSCMQNFYEARAH